MRRGAKSFLVFLSVLGGFVGVSYLVRQTTTVVPTTVPPQVVACAPRDFQMKWMMGTGSAGTRTGWITLTKTTSGTCQLVAWPTLAFLDPNGKALPDGLARISSSSQLQDWNGGSVSAVGVRRMVSSGMQLGVALSWSSGNGCPTVSVVQLTLGATSAAIPALGVEAQCNTQGALYSPFFVPSGN